MQDLGHIEPRGISGIYGMVLSVPPVDGEVRLFVSSAPRRLAFGVSH